MSVVQAAPAVCRDMLQLGHPATSQSDTGPHVGNQHPTQRGRRQGLL